MGLAAGATGTAEEVGAERSNGMRRTGFIFLFCSRGRQHRWMDFRSEYRPRSQDHWLTSLRRAIQIHIRIAGVDAPELAHFGRPSQPYAAEALEWLRGYILHRRVRAYVYKRDQYDRVVSTVYVWRGLLRRDVGLQMLRQGLATVYEAKTGAEFGKLEQKYRRAEWWAKKRRKGMWAAKKIDFESPREFKARMGVLAEAKGGKV